MNKGQLIDATAADLGEAKATVGRVLDALLATIATGLREDEAVTIVGFGTFTRKQRAARTGRNPATGEPMQIKAATTVGFKPAQALKNGVGEAVAVT